MTIAILILGLLGVLAGGFFGGHIQGTTITGLKLAFVVAPAFCIGALATIVAAGFLFAGFGFAALILPQIAVAASLLGSLCTFLYARYKS